MKILFTIAVFLSAGSSLLNSFSADKGSQGEYFIAGKAYLNNEVMSDKMFEVKLGDEKWKVETNATGTYEIEVPWVSPCPSAISKKELDSITTALNPKWITVTFKGSEVKIENQWEKYAEISYTSKSEVTRKFDLRF